MCERRGTVVAHRRWAASERVLREHMVTAVARCLSFATAGSAETSSLGVARVCHGRQSGQVASLTAVHSLIQITAVTLVSRAGRRSCHGGRWEAVARCLSFATAGSAETSSLGVARVCHGRQSGQVASLTAVHSLIQVAAVTLVSRAGRTTIVYETAIGASHIRGREGRPRGSRSLSFRM